MFHHDVSIFQPTMFITPWLLVKKSSIERFSVTKHGSSSREFTRLLFSSVTEIRYKVVSVIANWRYRRETLFFDGICEIETNEWTDGWTDGRVYRIPCLLFCRWVVWRSPEPSWWPIASLVSLICTHRWTRPTQWTNVAHRVVLRKGSSRLLFFPHTPHSPFSHLSRVSPSSIFRRGWFGLFVSLLSSGYVASLLHRNLSFPRCYFFYPFLVHRVSLAIFSSYCRLLFHDVSPFFISSPRPSCMTSVPPFVLVDASTFSCL